MKTAAAIRPALFIPALRNPFTGSYGRALPLLYALLAMQSASAQDRSDLMSDVMRTAPGRERAERLVEIAAKERLEGRTKYAIEFALLGSAEAEQHQLEMERGLAQLELSRAHRAKGELDKAIAASFLVTRLEGSDRNGLLGRAKLELAELYLEAGHPQKALDHLTDVGPMKALDAVEQKRYMRIEAGARSKTLKPAEAVPFFAGLADQVARSKDRELLLDVLGVLATSQAMQEQYEEALRTEQRALELAMELDRAVEAAICSKNIGELHERLGNTTEALNSFERARLLVEDVPALRTAVEVNTAFAHARIGKIDVGISLLDKAITHAGKNGMTDDLPRLLRASATLEHVKGRPDKALERARAARIGATERNDLKELYRSLTLLAGLVAQQGPREEALALRSEIRALERRLDITGAQALQDREAALIELQRTEQGMADRMNRDQYKGTYMKQLALDAENHQNQLALLVYEKELEESARREESMAKDKARKELVLAQATLEAERNERMIRELDNDRMLQSLSMARMEAEKKERQRNLELLEERAQVMQAESRTLAAISARDLDVKRFSIALATSALLLALLALGAWLYTRRKKRTIMQQNEQIKGINKVLAEKDGNIQSSLRYAQTIQSAILPSESTLKALLPESFLYYRPLDKVSGDLPFVKQVGDTIYLAAIDCTGHGVPAAMMTFIAYYGLNELIGDDAHASCGRVLDGLHGHVMHTMRSRAGEGLYNDGMDIGLCRIDLATGRLVFSGAQLSLFLVRNGEVIRLKGDLTPLGDELFDRRTDYRDQEMVLEPGDSVYLFSDGIIHQFGGPDGNKKLSMRRLKELLAASSRMNLAEMKENTTKLFEDWKGDLPQTDDVLFIGMRYAA